MPTAPRSVPIAPSPRRLAVRKCQHRCRDRSRKGRRDLTAPTLATARTPTTTSNTATTTEYGQTAPAPPGNDAGSAAGPQNVAPVHIDGLQRRHDLPLPPGCEQLVRDHRRPGRSVHHATGVTSLTADPQTDITDTSVELNGILRRRWNPRNPLLLRMGDDDRIRERDASGPRYVPGRKRPDHRGPRSRSMACSPVRLSLPGGGDQCDRDHGIGRRLVQNREAPRDRQPHQSRSEGDLGPDLRRKSILTMDKPPIASNGDRPPPTATDPGPGRARRVGQLADTGQRRPQWSHAGVTYHFRLVASNQYGPPSLLTRPSASTRRAARTPSCARKPGSSGLPDCRAYELVTPSYAQGAVIFPLADRMRPRHEPLEDCLRAAFGTFSEETATRSTASPTCTSRPVLTPAGTSATSVAREPKPSDRWVRR